MRVAERFYAPTGGSTIRKASPAGSPGGRRGLRSVGGSLLVVTPRTKRIAVRTLAAVGAAAALSPGWRGRLVPATHDEILEAAARVRGIGVSIADGTDTGGRFDLQYLGSGWAALLPAAGLRAAVPRIVPPDFAAHVPPPVGGVQRADSYHRIVTEWHWPWWRPGGGLDVSR
ncbi:MAG: hypothetical protein HMLKMBBP_02498 [Planctomycetes bacterium]|nr:hypothetical protein [Planctomycetota bacterium]